MLTGALSFRERQPPSARAELMDAEGIDFESYDAAVRDLASVNVLSFGYRPTLGFLESLPPVDRPLTIVDIGSGHGDQLRAAGRFLARRGVRAELTGVDISPHAARSAGAVPFEEEGISIRYVTREAIAFTEDLSAAGETPDAILSTLFMHHLEQPDIVRFLRYMDANSRLGWFVNDIMRSRLASAGFEIMAGLLGKHPYVRYDGPVSFSRGFRRSDWEALLSEAGIQGAEIRLHHPYRLCVAKRRG